MDNDIFGKMRRNLKDNLAKPNLVKEISELRKRMATLREDNRKLRHELFQKSVKSQDLNIYFNSVSEQMVKWPILKCVRIKKFFR